MNNNQKVLTNMLNRFKFKPAFLNRQQQVTISGNIQDRFKLKTAPSHYPQLLFRLLQVIQFLSAVVVTVIMFWFIYHLRDSSIAVPWKFIFLLIVALLTIIAVVANIVIYLPTSPPSVHNAILNGIILLLWTVAFAILAIAMKWTLQRVCMVEDWDTDTGMTVCRVYKVLFAFALAELPITFLALCLDLVVRRQETFSGVYATTANQLQGQYDPYSESKRLTEPLPSPRVLSAGYGLRRDEKLDTSDEREMEMEPLKGPRGLGAAYRASYAEERRYDDEGEDIGYYRSGVESVHDVLSG